MSTLVTTPKTLFDYDLLPDADRAWLREQEEKILLYCRRTLAEHIRAGEVLIAVQNRLPEKQFNGWLESNRLFSRSTAYSLMSVAENFAGIVQQLSEGRTGNVGMVANIDVKALHLLSQRGVPDSARVEAIKLSVDGRVSVGDALRIIKTARQVQAQKNKQGTLFEPELLQRENGEMVPYAEVRDEVFRGESCVEPPEPLPRSARAFALLAELCRDTATLSLGTLPDTEDDDVVYTGRAIFIDDDRESTHASAKTLEDVVEQLAGREETKVCPKCRQPRPLREFNANQTKRDGLASECRACYLPRMKAVKRKANEAA